MSTPARQVVSECFVKPHRPIEESNQVCYLAPWDIAMLSAHYIQKGLLFKKPAPLPNNPQQDFVHNLLENLLDQKKKKPLGKSQALPFPRPYPFLPTIWPPRHPQNPRPSLLQCLRRLQKHPWCQIHLRDSRFDHFRHPLTELVDGVFIGCSMNHCIGDGTAYWNFFNTLSEIFQAQGHDVDVPISRKPIHDRFFPEGSGPLINLPFKHHDEFIARFEAPKLRERIFHLTAESIAKLKEKANRECNNTTTKISSFQSLSALVWRSITRARNLSRDQRTSCKLATNNRTRMEPPMPEGYFGNLIDAVSAEATAGELLDNDLGWAAWKVHVAVANHNDGVVKNSIRKWLQSPIVYRMDLFFDPYTVMMGSSPRFNMYGNEFGMGKAVAVRSGYANKFDGKVTSYPGREGGGSIDLEMCLSPENMMALESDQEFMDAVSVPTPIY